MRELDHHDAGRHDDVLLLLPWYANGSLAAAERREVEEHLSLCAGCREELERCRGLAAAVRAEPDHAPSPHPIQLSRLMARIEAIEDGASGGGAADGDTARAVARRLAETAGAHRSPAASAAVVQGTALATPGRALFAATPRPVRWLVIGQLAALLLVAVALATAPGALGRHPGGQAAAREAAAPTAAPLFRTLSAPAANAGATGAPRPQIRVVFSETATEKQIRDVLLRVRGRLIDGPSPLGTYTLEVPAALAATGSGDRTTAAAAPRPVGVESSSNGTSDSLGCVLAYLHGQAVVRFAEPVAGAAGGGNP